MASLALARIGKDAVPGLIECLRDSNPRLRSNAAKVLSMIDPPAIEAVEPLEALLKDPEVIVQITAEVALSYIRKSSKKERPQPNEVYREGNR